MVNVGICSANLESEDEEVEEKVFKAVELAGGIPERLRSAKKILVKPNLGFSDTRRHKGRLIALTEPCVTNAVLRMIRNCNDNEIIIADGPGNLKELVRRAGYAEIIRKNNARILDSNEGPFAEVPVPHGGSIFKRYLLNQEIIDADAVVSIAKLKSHLLTGVSLCIKNLFGLAPMVGYGFWSARWYLHYPVRLPRSLVDLASITKPCMNVIDGLVGEDVQEWYGPPLENNLVIAGNNIVATDAVGATLMGHNPEAEFPEHPFQYDMNHIRLASSVGLGPIGLEEINVGGERIEDVRMKFLTRYLGDLPSQVHLEARRKVAKEVEYYIKNLSRLVNEYNGKVIGIENCEVKWTTDNLEDVELKFKPHELTVKYRDHTRSSYQLPFIKRVAPAIEDPEIYEGYFVEDFKDDEP